MKVVILSNFTYLIDFILFIYFFLCGENYLMDSGAHFKWPSKGDSAAISIHSHFLGVGFAFQLFLGHAPSMVL